MLWINNLGCWTRFTNSFLSGLGWAPESKAYSLNDLFGETVGTWCSPSCDESFSPPTQFYNPPPLNNILYLRGPIQQNKGSHICVYTQPPLADAHKPDCQFASSEMTGRIKHIKCSKWTLAFWISFSCSGYNSAAVAGILLLMLWVHAFEGVFPVSFFYAGHLFLVLGV